MPATEDQSPDDKELLTVAHDLQGERISQRDLDEHALEKMPPWVAEYLACWGSKKPDGGRMTVTFAAEFAGTTTDAVRQYRKANASFRRLEEVARYAGANWARTYVEAGLRGLAPDLMRNLAYLINVEKHPQTIMKALGWMLGPQELNLSITGKTDITADELAAARERALSLEDELLSGGADVDEDDDGSDD